MQNAKHCDSVEEYEVSLGRGYGADVEIDSPVDNVKDAEEQRENEPGVAVDGGGESDARRHGRLGFVDTAHG